MTAYRIDLTHPNRPDRWTWTDLAPDPETLARFLWAQLAAGWTVTATPAPEV